MSPTHKIEIVLTPDDRIVAMVEYRGRVYVATERRVFRMTEDDRTGVPHFDPVLFHQLRAASP